MPIGLACNSFLQSPIKLQDSGDFRIPYCIGDIHIERELCDMGASVSLMPLSLYRRLTLLDLTPTTISIQLADCSTRQPVGILEDLLVRVGAFIVPCNFFVVDMEESPHMPLMLGRPFPATAKAKNNVQAGTLSLCICGERVNFCFPPPIPTPAPATCPPPPAPVPVASPDNFAASRHLMEIEAPTYGVSGMLILCRSQLVLGFLLLILGKYWAPLHHPTPSSVLLLSHHCLLFGGKGRATNLKQALLERQPKHLFVFHKKKKKLCVSPLLLFFTLELLAFPSPWYSSLSFSLRTMKISSMGGELIAL